MMGLWANIVPPVATFLPLEAVVKAAVCENAFLGGATPLERLFEEGFLWKCLAKEEGTLSAYSRDLNESTNVVEIFRDWILLINSAKTQKSSGVRMRIIF